MPLVPLETGAEDVDDARTDDEWSVSWWDVADCVDWTAAELGKVCSVSNIYVAFEDLDSNLAVDRGWDAFSA